MRNQYKILAEKYNLIKEASMEPLKHTFLVEIMLGYTALNKIEIPEFIDWADKIYRVELGFHPEGETLDEIAEQLVFVYGEDNGLLVKGEWKNSQAKRAAESHVANMFYNAFVPLSKAGKALKKGSDEAGFDLDV